LRAVAIVWRFRTLFPPPSFDPAELPNIARRYDSSKHTDGPATTP
jgi:hypothetical protein